MQGNVDRIFGNTDDISNLLEQYELQYSQPARVIQRGMQRALQSRRVSRRQQQNAINMALPGIYLQEFRESETPALRPQRTNFRGGSCMFEDTYTYDLDGVGVNMRGVRERDMILVDIGKRFDTVLRHMDLTIANIPPPAGKIFKYQFQMAYAANGFEKFLSLRSNSSFEEAKAILMSAFIQHTSGYVEFDISKIILNVWCYDGISGQGTSEAQESSESKFYIVSSKTKTNCLYHSFTISRNPHRVQDYMESPAKLENAAKMLKRKCNDKTSSSGSEQIQALANHTKTWINLYVGFDHPPKEFIPETSVGKRYSTRKPVNILLKDGHYSALLEKSLQPESSESEAPAKEAFIARESNDDGLIKVFRPKNVQLNKNLAACDIEASNDENGIQTPYSFGRAWKDGYKYWEGTDCVKNYFDYMYDNIELFSGETDYFHNSCKYDALHLMRSYLLENTDRWTVNSKKSCCSDGRWLRLTLECVKETDVEVQQGDETVTIKKKKRHTIKIQDSLALISMPLKKACVEFNVEHQKLDETVCHKDITLDNWHTFPQLRKYLEHDCRGLYEVLCKFGEMCYIAGNEKINIQDCLTAATFAKKNYMYNYYDQWNYPIYKESKEDDAYVRGGYFGGRNEIFVIPGTHIRNCYYDDFTSLYPAMCMKMLPYGKGVKRSDITLEEITSGAFFGFVRCMVRTIDFKRKPIHGVKDPKTKRLLFKQFKEWHELTLFSEEVKLGSEQCMYEYKIIDGLQYKKAPILAKIMDDCVKLKAAARAAGNDGQAGVYKIIANSVYGFWALNTHDREGLIIGEHHMVDARKYLNDDKLIGMSENGKYTTLRVLQDIDVKDTCISIAAAITSYSRLRLWELMDAIEKVGHEIYYCDTDSVISSCNVELYPHLMDEFKRDGTGKKLGSLKDESEELIDKHFTKKIRKQHKYKDTEKTLPEHEREIKELIDMQTTRSFDSGVIGGLKFYSLQKTMHNGDKAEINKLKGGSASQLCHDDYIHTGEECMHTFECLNGCVCHTMHQKALQFKCGVSGYMDTANPYAIRVTTIPKTYRYAYTKGVVQADSVMLKPICT